MFTACYRMGDFGLNIAYSLLFIDSEDYAHSTTKSTQPSITWSFILLMPLNWIALGEDDFTG